MIRPRRPRPLFLAPPRYRAQRLREGAQLVPILGLFLFLLPLLWQGAAGAQAGLYLFAAWGLLIALTALLARRLAKAPEEPSGLPAEKDGGESDL